MMTTTRLGAGCFLWLIVAIGTAEAQIAAPWTGVTGSASVSDSISGTFLWGEVTLEYESGTTDERQGTAIISGADGKILAEAFVNSESATVIMGGVQISSEKEVTDDEARMVSAFAETKEAAAIRALVTALADEIPPKARAKMSGLIAIGMMLGEGPGARIIPTGDCFGCCGPGCWGCWLAGNCYTTACAVHDGCVDVYGHKDRRCLALLVVAIASYVNQCL